METISANRANIAPGGEDRGGGECMNQGYASSLVALELNLQVPKLELRVQR